MAVTLGPTPRYQWQGLSGDTKPTDFRVSANDLFFETDTGNEFIYNGAAWNAYDIGGGSGGTPAFSAITSGTNITAAMVVGSGASLTTSGTGTVNANRINGAAVPASAASLASNSSGQLIAGSGGGTFASSVTDATPGSSVNNYSPTGYTGGTTNRLLVTAASGGTTITGLGAASDGWVVLMVNPSATDPLIFPHLSASSTAANRFSNANAGLLTIDPLAASFITYVVNQWIFVS